MTVEELKKSTKNEAPPENVNTLCEALWYEKKGDWKTAHQLAQAVHSHYGSWVHAYLHRKEGDFSNASYWYHRANKPVSDKSLIDEWEEIAKEIVKMCYEI